MHACTHTRICTYILHTRTQNREHAEYIERGPVALSVLVMCQWTCIGVVLISSGVDVLLGAEKLNSSSEDQETDNTPNTRPLNELLPVHTFTVHLQHQMNGCTHNTRLMWSPPTYTNYTHTHTLISFHCTHPLSPAINLPLS